MNMYTHVANGKLFWEGNQMILLSENIITICNFNP